MNLLRYDFRSCSYVDTGSQMPQTSWVLPRFHTSPIHGRRTSTEKNGLHYSECTVTVRCCVCWRQRTLTVDGHILETGVHTYGKVLGRRTDCVRLPSGHLLWTDTYHGRRTVTSTGQ
eukprot:scaffold17051_cov168-Skeletonema_marinoi.AAC.4